MSQNKNNNQSPKSHVKWQPKHNSPITVKDGNTIQNNANNSSNAPNPQNRTKRIQQRRNYKNNNNKNPPQNSSSKSPSNTSDNNIKSDHNNSISGNIKINDEQPVNNEPQKEEKHIVLCSSVPSPLDTSTLHTTTQVLSHPNLTMLAPNTLNMPLEGLVQVKDEISSFLSIQTNVKGTQSNTHDNDQVNNLQTPNKSPSIVETQFATPDSDNNSPHLLQYLNNNNSPSSNPTTVLSCESIHSPNTLDSPNMQSLSNTIGIIAMGDNGINTGNDGYPFSYINTIFPPSSSQILNSNQSNLPMNLQPNCVDSPSIPIPDNHNNTEGCLTENNLQNMQNSTQMLCIPSIEISPTATEQDAADLIIQEGENRNTLKPTCMEPETDLIHSTSRETETAVNDKINETPNKGSKGKKKKKPKKKKPFVYEVFDAQMKIGIPADPSVSGIYLTTRARKILEKYAGLCEKNYLKVSKIAESLYEDLRAPEEDLSKRKGLLKKIQKIISEYWPDDNAKLHLFGSSANDFCLKGGDIDMCLTIDRTDEQKVEVVEDLGRLLVKHQMKDVKPLSGARVPIVKFTDPESGYSCDICINNTLALQNTKLLAHFSKIDPRLKKLACVIKYWAKRRQINAPFAGTLSSYAYVMLIIHFLQRRDSPIMPCLQVDLDNLPKVEVDGYDCTFHSGNLNSYKENAAKNKQSLGKLLIDFFKFYGLEFDYVNCVISVRTAGFFTKEAKNWKKPKHKRESSFLGLEDPFEVTHNLGRVVDKRGIEIIRDEFERGFIILARIGDLHRVNKEYNEDDQDCNWW